MPDPQKRTKSGIDRSLLGRVSTRSERGTSNGDDDDSINLSSASASAVAYAHPLSYSTSALSIPSSASSSNGTAVSPSTSNMALNVPSTPTTAAAASRKPSKTFQHRPHLSTIMSSSNPSAESASASAAQTSPPGTGTGPGPTGASIEQSVKLFRIFEALRSGDTAAIAKALKEKSGASSGASVGSEGSAEGGEGGRLEGTTVLHLAIQCAEMNVVEFILGSANGSGIEDGKETANAAGGVDINARDRDGNTPLHIAAMLGRGPIVSMLLAAHANDSITNYLGQTALDMARTPEIFQQLQLARSVFIDAVTTRIQSMVASKDYTQLEQLLQERRVKNTLDVNGGELATEPATVESGGTLLHEAARMKDIKLIQLLLLNGADPFRRDRRGKLPQDVTKDDRTRMIIKKSPAAAAAQRGIQEKTILGGVSQSSSVGIVSAVEGLGSKDGREMKGYLKKWTNYTSGWKLRWFVLEDGVLSYYKHQDDAGSACRGAINMRIAKLYMDPQDKLRFEIQGKSSVKYHLRANHQVEAKRWYWALNNAIQWSKDEAKEEQKRHKREDEVLRQMRSEQSMDQRREGDVDSILSSHTGVKRLHPPPSNHPGDDEGQPSYEPSVSGAEMNRVASHLGGTTEHDDGDDGEFDHDGSSREGVAPPVSRDAFNITAQSAKFQLDLLAQVSSALHAERVKNPELKLSDAMAMQALNSYEAAVGNLKGLVGDLLKISRDRDAYWQYRLDREANIRRLWEESMAKVAKEQEELQARMGESETKRKKTKRALRDALGGLSQADSRPDTPDRRVTVVEDAPQTPGIKPLEKQNTMPLPLPLITSPGRRKTGFDVGLSDTESDEDEEFFDAVDAGEVEVVEDLPATPGPAERVGKQKQVGEAKGELEGLAEKIAPSFRGYEDGMRKKLKLDIDDRPKVSLWGVLKSMIGKDITKMTLPVSFNEPTSLLQRTAEDMEYTELLDMAADRADPTERMVYVAAFAASEYASTIGRVAKPFNPLLGETYEYCRPDKGYRYLVEQVSHHPPVSAAWAQAVKWDYFGEQALQSKFYGKSFEFNPLGTWYMRLRPVTGGSELYTWRKCTTSVIGIITGNPVIDNYGPMEIKNWDSGETCMLEFKPRGWKASSAFQMQGKVADSTGKTRWSMGGRWNDKLYARLTPGFEGAVEPPKQGGAVGGMPLRQDANAESKAFLVWEANPRPTGVPFNLTTFGITLNAISDTLRPHLAPTDTRLRPDQRAMENGEFDLAAQEKNRLEEKQRATRRRREAQGEEFVPRWFKQRRHSVTGENFWVFDDEYWKVRAEVGEGKTSWKDQRLEDIF